jgi:hypothetical protein
MSRRPPQSWRGFRASYLAPAEDVSVLLDPEAAAAARVGRRRGCPVALSLDKAGLSVRIGAQRLRFGLEELEAVELFELYLRIDVGTGVLQVPRAAFRSRSPEEICDLLHEIIGE